MALPPSPKFENPDGVRNVSGWGGVAERIKGRKSSRTQSVKQDWNLCIAFWLLICLYSLLGLWEKAGESVGLTVRSSSSPASSDSVPKGRPSLTPCAVQGRPSFSGAPPLSFPSFSPKILSPSDILYMLLACLLSLSLTMT